MHVPGARREILRSPRVLGTTFQRATVSPELSPTTPNFSDISNQKRCAMRSCTPDPVWVCPVCSPPRYFGEVINFLVHKTNHISNGPRVQVPPSREAVALKEQLEFQADRDKRQSESGWEYVWPAPKYISREAAAAADRVRRRLGSEVVNFGKSGFDGDVHSLVSWSRDLIFLHAGAFDPRANRLATAAWAHKVRCLGIAVTPQTSDGAEPGALAGAVRHLHNLRELYLVVSVRVRRRRDLRWSDVLTARCLAGILERQGEGSIACSRDDFVEEVRPCFTVARAVPVQAGAEMAGLHKDYTAEDVNEATVFHERHWVDALKDSLSFLGRQIKIKWVL